MKSTLISSILGTAALFSIAIAGYGQGKINLDNYDSFPSNPLITYGSSDTGGTAGAGLQNGVGGNWTIGFYYALGDVTGSVANDPTTFSDPFTLGGGLIFATGAAGDTTTFKSPGFFTTTSDAVINGYTTGLITLEIVVYNGSSYGASTLRSHSPAFTMTPAAAGPNTAPLVGYSMPAFSVFAIPEPTVFAFGAIGSALFIVRRRKLRG